MLAVLRPAIGGPFKAAWEQDIASRDFPGGTELRTFTGGRRFEATLVSSRIIRKMMRMVDVRVGDVIEAIQSEVPSLSRPVDLIELDELQISLGNRGDKYVTAKIDDERLLDERDQITDILGSFIGPDVEWPEQAVEMNCAYLPAHFESRQIRTVQGIVGSIMPIEVDFGQSVILPRS